MAKLSISEVNSMSNFVTKDPHEPLGEEAPPYGRRGRRTTPTSARASARVAVSVVLSIAGLALPQAADPASASSDVPLRGRFEVTVSLAPDAACGGFRITAEGSGRATHLGRTTAVFEECANFVQEPGRVHVYGTGVLTSASGDELHLRIDKVGDLPDASGNVGSGGSYRVTGGTGRFAGAAGCGDTSAEGNIFSGAHIVELMGNLVRTGHDEISGCPGSPGA